MDFESRFLHALSYCALIPGPEAQQLAVYIGWLLHGTIGGVVAVLLFVLPGFFTILALSIVYAQFQQVGWLVGIFFGLKAAVLAIVVEAVIRVAKRAFRNNVATMLAALAFLALFVFALPFPVVVLGAGLVGFLGSRYRADLFAAGGHQGSAPDLPSVIDADFVQEAPTLSRSVRVTLTWVVLWIAPLLLIVPLAGWSNSFLTIFAFFSQMAVVTFGGAYAVLAYVAQEAVQHFGWLKSGEMLDGLALADVGCHLVLVTKIDSQRQFGGFFHLVAAKMERTAAVLLTKTKKPPLNGGLRLQDAFWTIVWGVGCRAGKRRWSSPLGFRS